MAAPMIVFISYGIPNPIKFRPKIKIDPMIVTITATATMIKTMDPTKRAGLPFAFANTFANTIALESLRSFNWTSFDTRLLF